MEMEMGCARCLFQQSGPTSADSSRELIKTMSV